MPIANLRKEEWHRDVPLAYLRMEERHRDVPLANLRMDSGYSPASHPRRVGPAVEGMGCTPQVAQNPRTCGGFLNDRLESHLTAAVGADERVYFVHLLDQASPAVSGGLAVLGIRFDCFLGR